MKAFFISSIFILTCHAGSTSRVTTHPPIRTPPIGDRPDSNQQRRGIDGAQNQNVSGKAQGSNSDKFEIPSLKLSEIKQEYSSAEHKVERNLIENMDCCYFERPESTKFENYYKEAEKKIKDNYFNSKFQSDRVKIVFTTDDTILTSMVESAKDDRFILSFSHSDWHSETSISRSLTQFSPGSQVILVGHQEEGMVIIRRENGEFRLDIKKLQGRAEESGIELLIWSCESADHATGGAISEFRETPLISSLISTLSSPPEFLGGFYNKIAKDTGIQLAFNAIKMFEMKSAIVRTIDESGIEATTTLFAPKPEVFASSQNVMNSEEISQPDFSKELMDFLAIPIQIAWSVSGMIGVLAILFYFMSGPGDEMNSVKGSLVIGGWIFVAIFVVFAFIGLLSGIAGNKPIGVAGLLLVCISYCSYKFMKVISR